MPKEDVSRRAVIKAAANLYRAVELVRARVPYGPRNVQMTPSELMNALKHARAAKIASYMDMLGPDAVMELMRERNNGTST